MLNRPFADCLNASFPLQLICEVSSASRADVDVAVRAAKSAFEGEWGTMSARDRGQLLFRYARYSVVERSVVRVMRLIHFADWLI